MYNQSLDLLPGGWYPGFKELYDNATASKVSWMGITLDKRLYAENHTHIPTASALAYGKGPNPNPNRKWDDDIRYINLSLTCGTREIPFHSYQGPLDFNTRHDALFESQAQFLINEITGNIATIPGLVISGPTNACNNISSSYSVNLPPGGSVVWSSFPTGLVSLSPDNSYAVEATPINNPTGSYTLTATVTASCITTPVHTQVNFYSTPPPPYDCYEIGNGTCSQTQYLCTEQFFTEKGFTIPNNIPGVPYWHWVVYGGTFSDGSTDKIVPRSTNMMTVTPQWGYMSYVIYITPVSECMVENFSPFSYVVLNTNQPWPCDGYYFTMSPNPASSDITVSTLENSSKSGTDRSITSINIYNQQGMLKKQRKFGKVKTASMSVSDLTNGTYVIEIVSGDYKERKQLIVQH